MKRGILFGFVVCVALVSSAQLNEEQFNTRLKQAQTLYQLGRALDALPLYEEAVKLRPDSIAAQEGYAMSLLMSSATIQDVEQRKQMRRTARAAFIRARELGDNSNLAKLADDIPEDGSFPTLSDRSDVDTALQAGESAYARGDYDQAISDYKKALALDPGNYLAALYIGDVLFKQAKYDDAGQWFQNAIAINPNTETAYRYWGDALIRQEKWDDAKAKFMDAIIADPYNRRSWMGLLQWADARGLKLVRPNIEPPTKVEDKDEKNINITLNFDDKAGKDDVSGAAWLMYAMTHAVWKNEGEFLKKYPAEKVYRHSLAEEMAAFTGALEVVKANQKGRKKEKVKADEQLRKLMELEGKGLSEPYILLHRADDGIARDYAAYRDAHRDKLREYLESLIVSK